MNNNKIVLIGDGCTGKSTMFKKICDLNNDNYKFDKSYEATDSFNFKRINLNTNIKKIRIDLWDTAGQENRGGAEWDAYFQGADGGVVFYDVSNKNSIANIPKWLNQIQKVEPNIPIAVIGNKADKLDDLTQCETVKLRECNLQRDIGHSSIKNFLVSIKEDTHIESSSSFWSSKTSYNTEPNCLVGLEYLLSKIHGKSVNIIV